MHPSLIRRIHANAIFHEVRLHPQTSQGEIVARTGFDKSTVSSVINRFDELGLVLRSQSSASQDPSQKRRGRPTESISISPDCGLLVGVQVEEHDMHFVATGLDGMPLASIHLPFSGALAEMEALVTRGLAGVHASAGRTDVPVLAVGVSFPGLVSDEGELVHAPVLGWRNVDVFGRLSRVVEMPLYVGNDGKAAAMAEHMFGSCIDVDDFIYLFSGSGVGGALFLRGQMYLGSAGFAGELGHIKVVPHGRLCSCGAAGCLSAYLSENALLAEINHRGGPVRSFGEILERAEAGDPVVLAALDQAGEILGSAVADLINIFNPPVIALGGDMSRAEPYLKAALDRSLLRLAHPSIYAGSRVRFSEMSAKQPYLGGVALALDGVTGLESRHVLP